MTVELVCDDVSLHAFIFLQYIELNSLFQMEAMDAKRPFTLCQIKNTGSYSVPPSFMLHYICVTVRLRDMREKMRSSNRHEHP